ncbi:hypothetical protein HanIR_Chr13g0639691 [Helianthus annuus]|nr:hypothetical protein HanIR_Chr13g0639691 [Helianthus annuus]
MYITIPKTKLQLSIISLALEDGVRPSQKETDSLVKSSNLLFKRNSLATKFELMSPPLRETWSAAQPEENLKNLKIIKKILNNRNKNLNHGLPL